MFYIIINMNKEDFIQYGGNTPELSIMGTTTYGRVVDIYDGDTLKIVLPVYNSFYKFTIRLSGIDTCEIKSKNIELKNVGIKARDKVFKLVTDIDLLEDATKNNIKQILDDQVYLVWIECMNTDKYGRVLANVYKDKDKQSFSEILLNENLAYSYEGKKKLSSDEQHKMFL